MVQLDHVETQLRNIGCIFRFFGRPEVKELAKIIQPGETIAHAVNGYYEGGFALLVVTDQRLLLIDRKPMFLTIEDIRFDMIAEIDFNHRLLNATARIFSMNKTLVFTTWNHAKLRFLIDSLQHRVMQLRTGQQHHILAVQNQFSRPQPQQPTEAPATIAQVAMEGANAVPISFGSTARNPYQKMPLLSRRRKFPSFY
jgi:Bacterial PH domain